MSRYLIYGLVDPQTKQLRYIGKSSSGLKRADQHKFRCRLDGVYTHKANWIRELQSKGLSYEIVILFELPDPDILLDAEKFWIGYWASMGSPLTNSINPIGHGPITKIVSDNTRQKIRQKKLGVRFSEEHKRKLSLAKQGCAPWNKGIPMREESRMRLKETLAKKWPKYD